MYAIHETWPPIPAPPWPPHASHRIAQLLTAPLKHSHNTRGYAGVLPQPSYTLPFLATSRVPSRSCTTAVEESDGLPFTTGSITNKFCMLLWRILSACESGSVGGDACRMAQGRQCMHTRYVCCVGPSVASPPTMPISTALSLEACCCCRAILCVLKTHAPARMHTAHTYHTTLHASLHAHARTRTTTPRSACRRGCRGGQCACPGPGGAVRACLWPGLSDCQPRHEQLEAAR